MATRFIKPKIDKYIQLFSDYAHIEDGEIGWINESVEIVDGGEEYVSGETFVVASPAPPFVTGAANASVSITITDGKITDATLTNAGSKYVSPPDLNVTSTNPATFVKSISIDDSGTTYTTAPTIKIDYPPTVKEAVLEVVVNDIGQIDSITIIDGGLGYTSAPTITLRNSPRYTQDTLGSTWLNATVETVTIDQNGTITSIEIGYVGSGYDEIDSSTIIESVTLPPQDNRAKAVCTIDSNGSIDTVTITDAGAGYNGSEPPVITVTPNENFQGRPAILTAHMKGNGAILRIKGKYQIIKAERYTWELENGIEVNENALLQVVDRHFSNIPTADADTPIVMRMYGVSTPSVVNTNNISMSAENIYTGKIVDIGKPNRVLPNDIKLEITPQTINRITLSLNHGLTDKTGLEFSTKFVIILKVTEKEPTMLEYGSLNNLNINQV